jgi:hypothetical protein
MLAIARKRRFPIMTTSKLYALCRSPVDLSPVISSRFE